MEKRTYIQPEMEVTVVATSAMMEGNALSGGSFPNIFPGNPTTPTTNPAPKRLTEIF